MLHVSSLGMNINLHHLAYDRDEFRLHDPEDPLLARGTSSTSFGAGFGMIYIPFKNLYFGLSADNINQPDMSLEGGQGI